MERPSEGGGPAGNHVPVLDSLRGLAALTVALLAHYTGFRDPVGAVDAWFLHPAPLLALHKGGWLAVNFFFLLSGYLFTYKYRAAIAEGTVSARSFFVLRFSRLYPLHLLTLLLVAALAWGFMGVFGRPPYLDPVTHASNCHYDGYHFLLNFLFLQGSGLQGGFSFNGPSWSLTPEAFCYLLFFCFAIGSRFFSAASALMIVAGVFLLGHPTPIPFLNFPGAEGLMGFFSGALLHEGLQSRFRRAAFIGIVAFPLILGGLSLPFPRLLHWFPTGNGANLIFFFSLAVFPALLAISLEWQGWRRLLEHRALAFFGTISYSIYLLHCPIQIALITFFHSLNRPVPVGNFLFFLAYAALVIGLSALCYRYVELPAQDVLRRRFLPPRPEVPRPS